MLYSPLPNTQEGVDMLVKQFDIDAIMAVPETTRAYMAGFFDGEGSVSISSRGVMKCSRTDPTKTKRVYGLVVHISQNSPKVLELYHDIFGGTFRRDNRKRAGYSPRAYVMWEWMIAGNLQVPVFLKWLRKYLVVKADEVDVALEFGDTYKELSDEEKIALADRLRAVRKSRSTPVLTQLN